MGCWTNVHLNDNNKMGQYLIGTGELDNLSEKWTDSDKMFFDNLQPIAQKYNLLENGDFGYNYLFTKDILIKEKNNIKFSFEKKPKWILGVIKYMEKHKLNEIWLGIDF